MDVNNQTVAAAQSLWPAPGIRDDRAGQPFGTRQFCRQRVYGLLVIHTS